MGEGEGGGRRRGENLMCCGCSWWLFVCLQRDDIPTSTMK